jgi:hypothetical protein
MRGRNGNRWQIIRWIIASSNHCQSFVLCYWDHTTHILRIRCRTLLQLPVSYAGWATSSVPQKTVLPFLFLLPLIKPHFFLQPKNGKRLWKYVFDYDVVQCTCTHSRRPMLLYVVFIVINFIKAFIVFVYLQAVDWVLAACRNGSSVSLLNYCAL